VAAVAELESLGVKAKPFIKAIAALLVVILLLGAYVGSFSFFVQLHLTTSMIAGTTHTYIALADTPFNRALLWFYSPILPYAFPAGPPIRWFSADPPNKKRNVDNLE
jgi:hypothetical protein